MAGSCKPGPQGHGGISVNIQDGTLCLQASSLPGPSGCSGNSVCWDQSGWLSKPYDLTIAQQAFRLPVRHNDASYRGFDWILHEADGSTRFHTGIDYYCSDLKAMATCVGVVYKMVDLGSGDHKCGNSIIIEHTLLDNTKIYSMYCHLASFDQSLAVGNAVLAGDVVGTIGETGAANGVVHLHFEMKFGGTLANPWGFGKIVAGKYWGYVPTDACVASAVSATSYGYIDPNSFYDKVYAKGYSSP